MCIASGVHAAIEFGLVDLGYELSGKPLPSDLDPWAGWQDRLFSFPLNLPLAVLWAVVIAAVFVWARSKPLRTKVGLVLASFLAYPLVKSPALLEGYRREVFPLGAVTYLGIVLYSLLLVGLGWLLAEGIIRIWERYAS